MTVASLWKALDRAGCGKRVGAMELQDHLQLKTKTNPWNFNEMEKISRSIENHPTLAIDLSIWICEALTSSAMKQNHVVDPSLQLVYCRILKLLNLGIKLVVVIEGKRRIRHGINGNKNKNDNNNNNDDNDNEKAPGEDKFRKRRSGAPFWTACERCEEMLKLVGVIVVRAKAEGEALCALLNQRNIVDGVISNDGDCLLFGAKTIYTHLNIENLEKCNVTRYDASDIRAVVDDDDADEYDETRQKSKEGQDVVKLSRNDLIAFAILTGSDIAGDGLSKIGCRKAIRFIRKCQMDNPLKKSDGNCSPSLEQLISWEETTFCKDDAGKDAYSGPHCGCCGHQGTKTSHKKHGCEGCGTETGEACFQLSPGGRFRKSLRTKALDMRSTFDPSSTVRAYHEPNENQVPYFLVGKTARTLKMNSPQFEKLLQSSFIIRGHSLQESREFIKKSLSAYLARQELFGQISGSTNIKEDKPAKLPKNHNRPVPIQVNKLLVRGGKPSCQVKWMVKATMSDSEGNPLDQYEFLTIEEECVIQKCYPKLIQKFQEEEQKLKLQGTAEQEKRRIFLLGLDATRAHDGVVQVDGRKKDPARKDHFDKDGPRKPTCQQGKRHAISDDVKNILIQMAKKKDSKKVVPQSRKVGPKNERYDAPLREIICTKTTNFHEIPPKQPQICKNDDTNMILGNIDGIEQISDDSSTIKTRSLTSHDIIDDKISTVNSQEYFRGNLTPGHIHFLGSRSVPQRELKRYNNMREENSHTRINISRSNAVPRKLLKLACSDGIERKNTRHDQYQRTYCRKEDLKSISKNLLSRVRKQGYDSNGASRIEHGRSEKLQERLFVESINVKESMVGQPYPATDSRQKSPSHSPMVKRRKDKVKGGNRTYFNEYLYEDREIPTAEDILTAKHSSPRKIISSRQIYEENDYDDELDSVGIVRTNNDKYDGNVKAFADPFYSKLEMQFDEAGENQKIDSGEVDSRYRSRHDEYDGIHKHLEHIPTVRKNKSRVVNSEMGPQDEHNGSVKAFADPFSSKLEMQFDEANEIQKVDRGELNKQHRSRHDEWDCIHEHLEYIQTDFSSVTYESHDLHGCLYEESREYEDTNTGTHHKFLVDSQLLRKHEYQSEDNEVTKVYHDKYERLHDYELENIRSNSYHYDKSERIISYAQSPQHQAKNVKYKRRRSVDRKACIYKNNGIISNSTIMEDPLHVDENSGCQMYHRRESTHRSMGNGCCCNESIYGQSYKVQLDLLDKRRGLKENVTQISDPFSCSEYQEHRQHCWHSSADDEIRTDPEDLAYHLETPNHDLFSKEVVVSEEIEKRVATKLESFNRRAKIGLLCSKYIGDDRLITGPH
jgi:5'-3' exonuclease